MHQYLNHMIVSIVSSFQFSIRLSCGSHLIFLGVFFPSSNHSHICIKLEIKLSRRSYLYKRKQFFAFSLLSVFAYVRIYRSSFQFSGAQPATGTDGERFVLCVRAYLAWNNLSQCI